ncbi:hypothetical protein CRG98_049084, partial [Punica granatum]
ENEADIDSKEPRSLSAEPPRWRALSLLGSFGSIIVSSFRIRPPPRSRGL